MMREARRAAALLAAVALPLPAAAQDMHGMRMDMPMPAKPAPKPKPARSAPPPSPSPSPPKAGAQVHRVRKVAQPSETPRTDPGPPLSPGKQEEGNPASPPLPAAHDVAAMPDMAGMNAMPGMPGMAMNDAPIPYGEGSGTSRNPGGDGAMHGLHIAARDWMLMLHGYAWGVYTDQGGPRGSDAAFVETMAMLSAARDLGGARLQLRSMLSLEPLIGPRGYPNLFATGETADGRTPLLDRQHPHDLFMELSARVDVDAGPGTAFLYGGPVAEPALGPPAFMHRASARYQPLSPITHHWFDSTHISYGVVTAGYATARWQIEASGFRGREPDQHRWDIERPSLDSWSVRATWTPSPDWAVQVSHGHLASPEQLEPARDETRTTASVQYAAHGVSALLAWSRKRPDPGRALGAWLGEVNWDVDAHHSLFARAESVANDELFPDLADPLHDVTVRVARLEGGYAYRLPLVGPATLALGGTAAVYATPRALDAAYGRFPVSFSLFAKVSLGP